jgi:membrane protease YdiL (CAAX protease family)
MQGWKSMTVICFIAAIMHMLVWYTKSLVPAMIVHGVYDVIAVSLIAAEASRQRQSMIEEGQYEDTTLQED